MGGRYYDSSIGRFMSMDPAMPEPADLHGLNRYAYANNNPLRYIDPDGRSPLDIGFFIVDAVRLGIRARRRLAPFSACPAPGTGLTTPTALIARSSTADFTSPPE